ncbi:hypothetical protein [Aeribacillus alveayuensis]|uniref:ABC-type branched-subunit amino acid transport system substrate-binding protein n=1 Tax=Aeribacillus alveayuensis TaxID=279215 RepID=A0ABT9VLX5_9BACI|nr:ABC-type branched-subunit amino acid transport system substrate-binding protein [Bacillus alveayuensis]
MKNFKKSWIIVFILMFLLSACSGGAINTATSDEKKEEKELIKIGALLPTTGVYASLGENLLNGMNLYFEENNWEVAGKKLK